MMKFKKAKYSHKMPDQKVQCELCSRYCIIDKNRDGFCKVRSNINGELVTYAYGKASCIAIDPIEKKPLFHFLPNTKTLSIGGVGCNLACQFCQNWSLSHAKLQEIDLMDITTSMLLSEAEINHCSSVAFTYNDPIINAEFIEEFSDEAQKSNIKSVIVSAGNITERARGNFFKNIDGANIDLKSFNESFYNKYTHSSLGPVKETLQYLVNNTSVWTEITTLLIPGLNDSDKEITKLTEWVSSNLHSQVPIHFSAFHPAGNLRDIASTPKSVLDRAYEIATKSGLQYVYTGNIHDPSKSSTYCKNCKELLIEREWFKVKSNKLKAGRCPQCQTEQDGIWT